MGVGLIAAIALAFGIQNAGIAGGYVDPILPARAQDEAVYAHAAAQIIRTGHWLTPVFLGRLLLNKPPLLMWAGAVSLRLFGVGPALVRLPALAAGVGCCLFVYLWLRRSKSIAAALCGVLLLLGDPLFHTMARTFMTDILLTFLITAAILTIAVDSRLDTWASAVLFGISCGAAILTKSAAGVLPLVILMLYFALARPEFRPRLSRIAAAVAAAILIAAPWHLYQWLVHRDWFMAEYVRFQLIGSGITAPSRSSGQSNLSFYAQRLLEMDPLLLVLWLAALGWLVAGWKKFGKEWQTPLLAAWCGAAFLVVLAFGTRVAYYLLPLIPAMALMAVQFSPLFNGRRAIATCAILLAAMGIKIWQPGALWGLEYRGQDVPSAAALDNYSRLRRANDLVIVQPDDEFYSATLDLPRVRYVYLGIADPTKTADFFSWLGVNLTARDYCNLPALLPLYQQRLTSWRAPDMRAIGLVILGNAGADLNAIIQCSPDRDFFLPDQMRGIALAAGTQTHVASESVAGRFFLLSKASARRPDNAHAPGRLAATHGLVTGTKPTDVTTVPSSLGSVFIPLRALSR